jgi:hypothetical protein
MLAYFPQVYPGELLYSVLARYHRHMGAPSTIHSMEALFGRRWVVASIDLPGSLQMLADRLPEALGWTADRIADELTLLPYYTAFQSAAVTHRARSAMKRGDTDGLLLRLGMATFRVSRVTQLRFCALCLRQMQARHGEYYWRRDHQLPGIFVCPEHGCPLQLSTVSVSAQGRHVHIPATRTNCPWHAPTLVADLTDSAAESFQRLAAASARLLECSEQRRTFAQWTRHYCDGLVATGFVRGDRHVDQYRLQESIWSHHRPVWHCFSELMDLDSQKFHGDWLATMTRKHRKAFHPLQHILLQDFIDHQQQVVGPFGNGPWPCHSPLAKHRNQTVVTEVKTHRNHDHLVGVFTCQCGYVYTRSKFDGMGQLGSPRFQSYGPLLVPALTNMVISGLSLRAIARRLELDPKTVVRLATEVGIPIDWKVGTGRKQATVITTDAELVEAPEPRVQIPRKPAHARTDWDAVDLDTCQKIRETARQLLAVVPPVRITLKQMETQLWSRGWLEKRSSRLPLATACVREVAESVEQFQRRRTYWVIRQMDQTNEPLQVWRIMRKAGLTSRHEGMVEQALDQYFESRQRTAA